MTVLDDETLILELRRMIGKQDHSESTTLAHVRERENSDPLRILVTTVLSQRTRDENTARASAQLFSKFQTLEALATAKTRDLERTIRPSGFYHVKARGIKKLARTLLNRHHGRVPETLEELMELPSVGRKTANCVLVYAFNKPAIPVDTHVHRISNRLGIVNTKTPEETESQLSKYLDRKYWIEINELMVEFGKTICKPIGPRCDTCRLNRYCTYYRKNKREIETRLRKRSPNQHANGRSVPKNPTVIQSI